MRLIFADAYYFVARLNRRDQFHERAVSYTRDIEFRLLTSDWILMEVADAFADSLIRGRMREVILDLRQSSACEIVSASAELFSNSLDLYHQHADKAWTLTDCTSFVIMRERGITEALTGDRHFEQAGFAALLK